MHRTGPLRRSLDDDDTINVHVEALNTDRRTHHVTVTVVNIDVCPVKVIMTETKLVDAGCWDFFNAGIAPEILHWEVRIRADEHVLVTVYHFDVSTGLRDDSLTYRHTQLIGAYD